MNVRGCQNKKGERIKFDIIESRDSDNVNYGRWVDEERDVQKKG